MKYFPNSASIVKKRKQVTTSVPGNGSPKGKASLYALWTRRSKPDDDDFDGNFLYLFSVMRSF